LAHAFVWEYSCKRLQLAQLLGQLGVFLTLVHAPPAAATAQTVGSAASASASAAASGSQAAGRGAHCRRARRSLWPTWQAQASTDGRPVSGAW
jgi:hypothetical protein